MASNNNDDTKNILYGGPLKVNLEEDTRSLGEYIIRELSGHGDKIAIVSVYFIYYHLLTISLSLKLFHTLLLDWLDMSLEIPTSFTIIITRATKFMTY